MRNILKTTIATVVLAGVCQTTIVNAETIEIQAIKHQKVTNEPFDLFKFFRLRSSNDTAKVEKLVVEHGIDTSIKTASLGASSTVERLRLASKPSLSSLTIGRNLHNDTNSDVSNTLPECLAIEAPLETLKTRSKYSKSDKSKSNVNQDAHTARKRIVQPIRNSVRMLWRIAYAQSNNQPLQESRANCVLENLDRWAANNSLGKMLTQDAILSRDRWIAEITLVMLHASKTKPISDKRMAKYKSWLSPIAKSTIEAYTMRLGPKSKMNNHRYWAGLSVVATGFLLNDSKYKHWGKRSYEIGACQVNNDGYLPGELIRGKLAMEYHLYAARPLVAIKRVSAEHGEAINSKCDARFDRLVKRVKNSFDNIGDFERAAGKPQIFKVKETSYSTALNIEVLGLKG